MQTEGQLLTPQQLRKVAEEKAMTEARLAHEHMKKVEEEQKHLREAFMSREIRPEAMSRVMELVRRAAEQGKHEVLIVQFPSDLLTDSGRRVNSFDPEWPVSLQGFAKRAYDYYMEHLKPHGYKLKAQILDFPGGKPGDVGLILGW
jgi:hypothetical protein